VTRNLSRFVLALALGLSGIGCGATSGLPASSEGALSAQASRSAALDAWKDEVIYFVLLDRFANGNRQNDFNVQPQNPTGYHGGDLDGLISKLPYLDQLGVTALWISPVVDNDDDQLAKTGLWGFHGYWAKNFETVDEHLGDEAKVKELLSKAHARGMKVMLDIVANHGGYEYQHRNDPRYKSWFNAHGNIQNWDDQWWLEHGSLFGLPDFNQGNPEARKYLIDVWSKWAKLGFDGFRVDTVKHVPKEFWADFNTQISRRTKSDFLLLGEVLHGDVGYVADYQRQGKFHSLFDFPLYYTFNDVFAKGASMRRLGDRFAQDASYPNAELLSPFLDNHDVPRFLSQAGGDHAKLKLALACVLTVRGIPSLYYGTEVGMTGSQEPENRQDMAWGQHPELTRYVQQLLAVRKASVALRRGKQLEMWQDDQVYAYSRLATEEEAIVVLNNDGRAQVREIPLRAESRIQDGTTLVDALSGEKVVVTGRKIRVPLAGKKAAIFRRG
jgi:glycosidase